MTESTVMLPPVGSSRLCPRIIYFINQANRTSRPAEIVEYTGDFEAIEKAQQFVHGHDVELWERSRLVMRFPHDPRK
jgi:hypothetical protein